MCVPASEGLQVCFEQQKSSLDDGEAGVGVFLQVRRRHHQALHTLTDELLLLLQTRFTCGYTHSSIHHITHSHLFRIQFNIYHPSIHPSIPYPSIHLLFHPFIHPSSFPSIHLFTIHPIYLSLHPSIQYTINNPNSLVKQLRTIMFLPAFILDLRGYKTVHI